MKKTISILLLALSLITICSCQSNGTPVQNTSQAQGDSITNVSVEPAETPTTTESPYTFEKYNILNYALQKTDKTTHSKEIISTYLITNSGTVAVTKYSFSFAYYDASGTMLCKDGRFNDVMLEPSKSALMKTYSNVDGEKDKVNEIKVVSYNYYTAEPDENGNNYFEINLETQKVTAKNRQND